MSNNDDITRKLIKESVVETHDDFADKIMEEINKSHQHTFMSKWYFYAFIFSLATIGGTMYFFRDIISQLFSSIQDSFSLPPMFLQILVLVFAVFAINKLMCLKEIAEKNVVQRPAKPNWS